MLSEQLDKGGFTYSELMSDSKRAQELIKDSCITSTNPKEAWQKGRMFISKEIDRDGTILDIGCANGLFLKSMQEWSGKALEPFGCDPNRGYIEEARKIFPGLESNFEPIPMEDYLKKNPGGFPDQFDYIYWSVWVNYDLTHTLIELLVSKVKDGGKLIIGFYPDDSGGMADVKGNVNKLKEFGYTFREVENDVDGETEKMVVIEKS